LRTRGTALAFALAATIWVCDTAAPSRALAQGAVRSDDRFSAQTLEVFFNPLVTAELEQHRATGIAIAVVRDGQVLFARGYGYMDASRRRPIDGRTTPFRVGSISKTFTAAAVMQLVEAGKLRLDEDIGAYLGDYRGRSDFGRAVTLEHLLSHTSGLDERNLASRVSTSDDRLLPWREYNALVLPRRLFPPAALVRYSNHNATLAGYIVEAASSAPFTRFIRSGLFEPLRMSHSSFARPHQIEESIPTGHIVEASGLRALAGTGMGPDPAASLAASAEDIAHFMIAMTSDGQFEGHRVLTPASIAAMERVHFESNTNPASGLGLWHVDLNGVDGWEHDGEQPGFVSAMLLVPSVRLGFFASANSSSGFAVRLQSPFIDRYFPAPSHSSAASPSRTALDCSAGIYRTTYYPSATIGKTVLLLGRGPELRIGPDEHGLLQVTSGSFHDTLRPLGERTFRNPSGHLMRFGCEGGRPPHYIGSPYSALERLGVVDRRAFQTAVLTASAILLVIGAAGAYPRRASTKRGLRWMAFASACAYFAFLLIAGAMLGGLVHVDFMETGHRPPAWLRSLLTVPIIVTFAVLATAAATIRALRRHENRVAACVSVICVLLASGGLGWLLNYWNLLPWRY
jgi:CubicO group peptidase (beta-lactamase class C family)